MHVALRLPDALFGANALQHLQSPVRNRSSILIHELLIIKQSASASASFQKHVILLFLLATLPCLLQQHFTSTHIQMQVWQGVQLCAVIRIRYGSTLDHVGVSTTVLSCRHPDQLQWEVLWRADPLSSESCGNRRHHNSRCYERALCIGFFRQRENTQYCKKCFLCGPVPRQYNISIRCGPRVTALARPRRNCTSKLQTRLLFRAGSTKLQKSNCLKKISRRK
jgi:hypothetical protein